MVENGDNKPQIEYAEIRKTINKRGHQEIQPRDRTGSDHGIKELEESQKNAEARARIIDHTQAE